MCTDTRVLRSLQIFCAHCLWVSKQICTAITCLNLGISLIHLCAHSSIIALEILQKESNVYPEHLSVLMKA